MRSITIFIFCFCITNALSNNINTDVIVSFLLHDFKPSNLVIPDLCWSLHDQKYLAKSLFKLKIGISKKWTRVAEFVHHDVCLVDMRCPSAENFLLEANNEKKFKSPYRWIIFVEYDFNNEILHKIDVGVDSNVVLFKRTPDEEFEILEVYKISENHDLKFKLRANLKRSLHFEQEMKTEFYKSGIDKKISKKKNRDVVNNKYENPKISYEPKVKEIDLIKEENVKNMLGNIAAFTQQKIINKAEKGVAVYEERKNNFNRVFEDMKKSDEFKNRNNLEKTTLTMALVITDSNFTKEHLSNRLFLNEDSISKMSYAILSLCFDILNGTEKIAFTTSWGYKDAEGNWDGMIRMMMENKADIGTMMMVTQDRFKVIDYIGMIGETSVRFIYRQPPLPYVANIFVLPFSKFVWIAILICIVASAIVMYFASKFEATGKKETDFQNQLDGSWSDVLIVMIGAVLQQGSNLEPKYITGRCVTLLALLSLTIVYSAYSANIVVLLSAPSSSIKSLKDLLNSPIQCGATDLEYNRYFFKRLSDPLRKKIYDTKISPKGQKAHFFTMKEGIAKVRKGLFAFHAEVNPSYREIQDSFQEGEKCDIEVLDYINLIDPLCPAQKNSPYKELFKTSLLRIRESGLQSAIYRRLFVPKPKCSGKVSTFNSVGLRDIQPVLLITVYAFLAAPLLLTIEILYAKLHDRRRKYRRNTPPFPYYE